MNKSRKIMVLCITIGVILLIIGGMGYFVFSLKRDKERTQAQMSIVSEKFTKFNEIVSKYETDREDLYTNTLDNLYFDNIFETDAANKERFKKYEAVVDEVVKDASNMDKLCIDIYYPDSSINNKCSNYKSIYEQVINYFLEDVKLYNNTVKEYNMMQEKDSTKKLVEYKTKKKYIDYNKDGVYDGKTEDAPLNKKEESENKEGKEVE